MEQLSCYICKNDIPLSLHELIDHMIKNHRLQTNHYDTTIHAEMIVPDRVCDDAENANISTNDEIIDFNLYKQLVRMIDTFQRRGTITGRLLVDVLCEFEQIVLSTQNFFKTKIHTFFQNKGLLDDNEAKRFMNELNFSNPFDELRMLHQLYATQEHSVDQEVNKIAGVQLNLGTSINSGFIELTKDDIENITIKLDPRKIQRKFVNAASKNPEQIIGTFNVESDGSVSANLENITSAPSTRLSQESMNSGNSIQPHCSQENPPRAKVDPACFSRCGSVEETLKKHPLGLPIILAARSSFTEKHRKALIRITVEELAKVHDSFYPPVSAKIALAKAIIGEFPRLRNDNSSEGYEHYYDEKSKRGFIEFRLWTMRTKLSPSKKKYKLSGKSQTDNMEISKWDFQNLPIQEMDHKINMLKSTIPTEQNKSTIIRGFYETYMHRRHWIVTQEPSIAQIFHNYPRLRDYNGEMIELEFHQMYPTLTDNFLVKFPSYYTPRILRYAEKFQPAIYQLSRRIKNECLRALLILAELMPVSNGIKYSSKKKKLNKGKGKKRMHEETEEDSTYVKPIFPNPFLLRFLHEGSNAEVSNIPISGTSADNICKPYMIMSSDEIGAVFIQVNEWRIEISENLNPIKAFNILYKFYYVCNVKYPPTLLSFYNFLDAYIYKMSVQPHNVVSSLHINISNINMLKDDSDNDD